MLANIKTFKKETCFLFVCGTDLDTRAVGKEGFGALRVVKGSVADTTPRSSNGEVPTVEQVARTVAVLGCFIHYLRRDQRRFRLTRPKIMKRYTKATFRSDV